MKEYSVALEAQFKIRSASGEHLEARVEGLCAALEDHLEKCDISISDLKVSPLHTTVDVERVRRFVCDKLLPLCPEGASLREIFGRKVKEESLELFTALTGQERLEEAVDVLIATAAFALSVTTSEEEITAAFDRKMTILEGADWKYAEDVGVFKRRR